MGRRGVVAGLFLAGVSLWAGVAETQQEVEKGVQRAVQSQERIDTLDDETRQLLLTFRRTEAEAQSLEA